MRRRALLRSLPAAAVVGTTGCASMAARQTRTLDPTDPPACPPFEAYDGTICYEDIGDSPTVPYLEPERSQVDRFVETLEFTAVNPTDTAWEMDDDTTVFAYKYVDGQWIAPVMPNGAAHGGDADVDPPLSPGDRRPYRYESTFGPGWFAFYKPVRASRHLMLVALVAVTGEPLTVEPTGVARVERTGDTARVYTTADSDGDWGRHLRFDAVESSETEYVVPPETVLVLAPLRNALPTLSEPGIRTVRIDAEHPQSTVERVLGQYSLTGVLSEVPDEPTVAPPSPDAAHRYGDLRFRVSIADTIAS